MLSSAAMNSYPGILIVFDGIDGAGKTTQVGMLEEALKDAGEEVIVSKEPTDGQWGAKLRASASTGRLPFDEELEAFINDRQEHLTTKIIPALAAGKVVILDRYFYSTIAYQGIRCDDISSLETKVRAGALEPDAALFLELPPEIAAFRIAKRDGEANHFEGIEDLVKIDKVFHDLARRDVRLQRIDGRLSPQAVHESILSNLVSGALKTKRALKHYGCDEPVMCGYRMTNACPWWRIVQKLKARSPNIAV